MPKSLEEVARTGSRLDLLIALRDYTAKALDECTSPRDQKSLLKELRDTVAEIAELTPPTEEVDPLADLVPDDDEADGLAD